MKKAGNLVTAIGIAAVGVAAGIVGKADDAPGLVLLGILLIVSGVRSREVRAAQQIAPAVENDKKQARPPARFE